MKFDSGAILNPYWLLYLGRLRREEGGEKPLNFGQVFLGSKSAEALRNQVLLLLVNDIHLVLNTQLFGKL